MALAEIQGAVAKAERKAGRIPGSGRLIAVSKVQPLERVEAVLEQGHRLFGENRVQEAQGKWPDFTSRYDGVELHLIGPLQSNKARTAMELFDAIHTLDRPKLATTLARLAQEMGQCPDLMIQVNTGEEPQKAGILPADADGFIAEARALDLPVTGLMCIPCPVTASATTATGSATSARWGCSINTACAARSACRLRCASTTPRSSRCAQSVTGSSSVTVSTTPAMPMASPRIRSAR